ncbi:MAG: XRE family transcriptional regulator [Clostridia bacterium]|nr:XRE family transcriptional regulator [Clostridia bacterium]
MSNIKETLEELLVVNGYNQKTFAEKARLNESCVTNYIHDGTPPSVDHLVKIAEFFNCSTDFLLGREELNDKLSFKQCPLFCERLRELPKLFGCNNEEFCKKARIARSSYFRWKNGERCPSLDNIIRIAEALDCRVDFILGRES